VSDRKGQQPVLQMAVVMALEPVLVVVVLFVKPK
jgi:hypothetical protein